ncbi:hypothetical protein E2C01_063919 [Portunus trituberculatus]|uniref:Uncharacterized protein n=1 Tax=Portunus trituberculatus TaxID=210409 RepID=A0A5B7HLW4_PORTR|nr:hypothetical protein [Portunus trituberculatus]
MSVSSMLKVRTPSCRLVVLAVVVLVVGKPRWEEVLFKEALARNSVGNVYGIIQSRIMKLQCVDLALTFKTLYRIAAGDHRNSVGRE